MSWSTTVHLCGHQIVPQALWFPKRHKWNTLDGVLISLRRLQNRMKFPEYCADVWQSGLVCYHKKCFCGARLVTFAHTTYSYYSIAPFALPLSFQKKKKTKKTKTSKKFCVLASLGHPEIKNRNVNIDGCLSA